MQGEQREIPYTLTKEETIMIQNTWGEVYHSKEVAGVKAFLRVFTSFPSSKQYFSDFQNMKDVEEIQASGLLKKHALRVMTGLNTLVENVRDGEKLVSVILLMAKSHALKHNIKAVYFKILIGAILEVLVETFPETFGVEVQWAWSKLIDIFCWHITQVYSDISCASMCE
ncbi:cytoglobin-2-like [Pangasianodon hypophthalmus]|uniref:cytoglobin-2-like n=1 Tax=Pangasianodon hypophthalmus TaxID=310915 RepID=UPI000EFEF2A5|nr:cytoglobin-2-like [Pangasianodon hypophthalmus]